MPLPRLLRRNVAAHHSSCMPRCVHASPRGGTATSPPFHVLSTPGRSGNSTPGTMTPRRGTDCAYPPTRVPTSNTSTCRAVSSSITTTTRALSRSNLPPTMLSLRATTTTSPTIHSSQDSASSTSPCTIASRTLVQRGAFVRATNTIMMQP